MRYIVFSILFLFFISCGNQLDEIRTDVIGEWHQIEPTCDPLTGFFCDTISFEDDGSFFVQNLSYGTYEIIAIDSILFSPYNLPELKLMAIFSNQNSRLEIMSYEKQIKESIFDRDYVFEK